MGRALAVPAPHVSPLLAAPLYTCCSQLHQLIMFMFDFAAGGGADPQNNHLSVSIPDVAPTAFDYLDSEGVLDGALADEVIEGGLLGRLVSRWVATQCCLSTRCLSRWCCRHSGSGAEVHSRRGDYEGWHLLSHHGRGGRPILFCP